MVILLASCAYCQDDNKFQQYIQKNEEAPLFNYNSFPYVSFNMQRYNPRYGSRYSFGPAFHFFAINEVYSDEYYNSIRHFKTMDKDTYTSPDEFRTK